MRRFVLRVGAPLASALAFSAVAAAAPTPLDPADVQVNTYATGDQLTPAVAFDPEGNFVIAWDGLGSAGSDASGKSIQARRFRADGTALDPADFQVNTYTTNAQAGPVLAVDPAGNFVVVWQSNGSSGGDTSGYSIQPRRCR